MTQLRQRLRDAVDSNDTDTMQAVRSEFQTVLDSRREIHQSLMTQLGDVLTGEQMNKVRSHLQEPRQNPGEFLSRLGQLQLTDAQQADVRRILADARQKAKNTDDPSLRNDAMTRAVETIRQTVLTDEQNRRLDEMLQQQQRQDHRREMLSEMHLTDEQKAKAETILADARREAKNTDDPIRRRSILARARRRIREEVWTDRQREQFRLGQEERYRREMRRIGMTDGQIARAETILTDARQEVRAALTDKQRREIMRSAMQTIRTEVMTQEQRAKLREQPPAPPDGFESGAR